MFNIFQNSETRLNDMAEGFGYFDDIKSLDDIGNYQVLKVVHIKL
jgi:hypothetical protein